MYLYRSTTPANNQLYLCHRFKNNDSYYRFNRRGLNSSCHLEKPVADFRLSIMLIKLRVHQLHRCWAKRCSKVHWLRAFTLLKILLLAGMWLLAAMHPRPSSVQRHVETSEVNVTRMEASDVYQLFAHTDSELGEQQEADHTLTKKILFWTRDYDHGRSYAVGLGQDVFKRAGCPVWQCETYDTLMNLTTDVEDFDAVVFHDSSWSDLSRPANRKPHQRYVLWTREAPGIIRPVSQWKPLGGFFNWTITHRWDSDVVMPYGWLTPTDSKRVAMRPKPDVLKRLLAEEKASRALNYAAGKTKMAAWFVSHCGAPSQRDEYVRRLKEFVDVDVYGKCGDLSCPKLQVEECRAMASRDYKFYIAFENSLCIDYVTEKFFSSMKHMNTVPIVFDLHGNHAQTAPPHSYINAADFPSVKALADYLHVLDKNDDLYNEYFWWKRHYHVHDHMGDDFKRGLCHLCTLLHRPSHVSKTYEDMTDWFVTRAQCQTIGFLPQSQSSSSKDYPWYSHSIKYSD